MQIQINFRISIDVTHYITILKGIFISICREKSSDKEFIKGYLPKT